MEDRPLRSLLPQSLEGSQESKSPHRTVYTGHLTVYTRLPSHVAPVQVQKRWLEDAVK
ncbi:hypothetical protein P7K49_017374 [Saguinus oedipus]|uniref:Uncharacterized protein n=1 Tax=Saguinus oedipus TaxID=9490 RepID=A0ABQ9V2B3_SAGOE|nr:hypothetical protein P7K49_017374 [Saguinus oedipus]